MSNKNTVELIGYYGSDETHACSAWTSTSRELSQDKKDRIPKLLHMLASEGHHTPFEKSTLHFLINTDVASHIHVIKHRVGLSVNAESARYKELKEDKYYLPEDWYDVETKEPIHIESVFGGSFQVAEHESWDDILEDYTRIGNVLYHRATKDLTAALGRKRAKESARYFKTYNSQIQADVSFNWRSFNHFLSLRMKDNAQDEIHEIASEMLRLVKEIPGNPFQYTIEAFGYA